MDLSGARLDELRRRVESSHPDAALRRLAEALRSDPRRGARRLGEQALRRIEERRRERRRMRALFAHRRQLMRGGARIVAGVDEVGVGPLAGPVVACAVVLPDPPPLDALEGLGDSKQLAAPVRERLARAIRERAVAVSIASASVAEVDRLNIYHAALEAMRRAVAGLGLAPDHVLVDARTIPGIDAPQTGIVGGDGRDASIAAASIVAKVHRDRLMERLSQRHPGYGFERHKGYATRAHLDALRALGPSPVHRRSFAPVTQLALW